MKKLFTLAFLAIVASLNAFATTYLIAGSHDILNGSVDWSTASTENDMTEGTDGTFSLIIKNKTVSKGTYEYKVFEKGGTAAYPQSNAQLIIGADAIYDITFTFNPTTLAVNATAVKVGDAAEITHTYTLVGEAKIAGVDWSTTATANDMTKGTDGIYSITKSGLTLIAAKDGGYLYKIARDHGWGVSYPSANAVLTVTEDGIYDVTFTFDPNTYAVNATAVKRSSIDTHTYTLVGVAAITTPDAAWTPSITANNMTKGSDGIFSITKTGRELISGRAYEYKVARDNSWDVCYPSQDNSSFSVTEDGVYSVLFTFDPATFTMNAVATKTGEKINRTYTLVGDEEVAGVAWNPSSTGNDMTLGEDKNYSITKTRLVLLKNKTYNYKVVRDHAWDVSYPTEGANATFTVPEDGTYDVTFTFDPVQCFLNATYTVVTGIATIQSGTSSESPIFNLAGQRVDKSAKGLLISKGKKYIAK
jgi:hypothetical protein